MHAFRSILLAITKQHTSDMELEQAFRMAADNRSRLLITMFDRSLETMHQLQFLPLEKKLEDLFRAQLQEELDRLEALAWEEGIKVETLIVSGRPRQAIHQVIKDYEIDLVIKLADTSGVLMRNQLTGNDLALLRKCPVPVLMMADRNQLDSFTGKIMVAMDVGDPDTDSFELNKRLLQYGVYLSAQENAQLHLVCVWRVPADDFSLRMLSDEELYELQEITRSRYQRKLKEIMDSVGLQEKEEFLSVHLLKGRPSFEIQRMANDINVDLVVMGTLGRHSKGFLIGNTAENILNGVYCSILAVKPEGFAYPQADVIGK
ncbi:hypothetical protein ACH42_07585 [Endozoicomonas sp. (ex Bugula neritina AB1)]|nr:hypothetical protein ACH42_07585 [Endozoicomonas sp. (ex Bugula neritina AB1)]